MRTDTHSNDGELPCSRCNKSLDPRWQGHARTVHGGSPVVARIEFQQTKQHADHNRVPEPCVTLALNLGWDKVSTGGELSMSVDNKQLIRQEFNSIWNEGEYHEERFTEDYVAHGWAPEPVDLKQEQADTAAFRQAFPDIHKDIEDVIAEDDKVVLRYRFTGTHQNEFEGIQPTGTEVSTTGIFIYRIEDGRIAESWLNYDGLNLLGQLGAI